MEKYGKFGWVTLGGIRGRRMVDCVEGYRNAKKMKMRGERKEIIGRIGIMEAEKYD